MDNLTLSGLLVQTPPADLKILDLMVELTNEDGILDMDRAAVRSNEVEAACIQAGSYARSTVRLVEALRWKLLPSCRN